MDAADRDVDRCAVEALVAGQEVRPARQHQHRFAPAVALADRVDDGVRGGRGHEAPDRATDAKGGERESGTSRVSRGPAGPLEDGGATADAAGADMSVTGPR